MQEACRRPNILVILYLNEVEDLALGHVLTPVANDVSFNNPLQGNAGKPKLQMNFNCFVMQCINFNSQCDTWRSLARESDTTNISLQASLDSSINSFKLLDAQTPLT